MMGKRIQHADEAMLKIVIQLGTQPTARADRAEGQRVKSGKRRVRLNSHQELLVLGVIYKDDSRIHPVPYRKRIRRGHFRFFYGDSRKTKLAITGK